MFKNICQVKYTCPPHFSKVHQLTADPSLPLCFHIQWLPVLGTVAVASGMSCTLTPVAAAAAAAAADDIATAGAAAATASAS